MPRPTSGDNDTRQRHHRRVGALAARATALATSPLAKLKMGWEEAASTRGPRQIVSAGRRSPAAQLACARNVRLAFLCGLFGKPQRAQPCGLLTFPLTLLRFGFHTLGFRPLAGQQLLRLAASGAAAFIGRAHAYSWRLRRGYAGAGGV